MVSKVHHETLPGLASEQTLAPRDRLEVVFDSLGFIPYSQTEATEALNLLGFDNELAVPRRKPISAAKHLAEVAIHQGRALRKLEEQEETLKLLPEERTRLEDSWSRGQYILRAARRIVRGYGEYAKDAQSGIVSFFALHELLDGANPELILSRVADIDSPSITPFIRHADFHKLVDGKNGDRTKAPFKYPYLDLSNMQVRTDTEKYLENVRVRDVAQGLPMAIDEQEARFFHWKGRLQEVVDHYPRLKPVAEDCLNALIQPDTQVE